MAELNVMKNSSCLTSLYLCLMLRLCAKLTGPEITYIMLIYVCMYIYVGPYMSIFYKMISRISDAMISYDDIHFHVCAYSCIIILNIYHITSCDIRPPLSEKSFPVSRWPKKWPVGWSFFLVFFHFFIFFIN